MAGPGPPARLGNRPTPGQRVSARPSLVTRARRHLAVDAQRSAASGHPSFAGTLARQSGFLSCRSTKVQRASLNTSGNCPFH